jgi:hypothetical protein
LSGRATALPPANRYAAAPSPGTRKSRAPRSRPPRSRGPCAGRCPRAQARSRRRTAGAATGSRTARAASAARWVRQRSLRHS